MVVRTSRLAGMVLALLTTLGFWSVPAAALCIAERSVFFIGFPNGSSTIPEEFFSEFTTFKMQKLSEEQYVESFYILASGDIAEGEDWDKASGQARLADQELGQARVEAVRTLIENIMPEIGTDAIEVKVRENRQVFSEADFAANPGLTPQSRAGVLATVRYRGAPNLPGESVPTC